MHCISLPSSLLRLVVPNPSAVGKGNFRGVFCFSPSLARSRCSKSLSLALTSYSNYSCVVLFMEHECAIRSTKEDCVCILMMYYVYGGEVPQYPMIHFFLSLCIPLYCCHRNSVLQPSIHQDYITASVPVKLYRGCLLRNYLTHEALQL